MAKLPKAKASTPKKKTESGLTGGPSTIRGVTYQGDHAVYLLLDQISLSLADPFTPRSIATEPRTTAPQVVRWDILTAPPETTFEAKFNPKREELVDWLKLVEQSSTGASERRFRFVYAEERAAAKLIQTVKALCRIAIEVNGVREAFDKLVAHEEVKDADEVLILLGDDASHLLQKIDLEQLSDKTLDSDIRLRLRYLTTPEKATELRNYLFEKLQRAAPLRVVFSVNDIIKEIREKEFTLYQPQRIEVGALSPNAFAALSAMENCKTGLPVEVLTVVTGMSPTALETELAPIYQVSSEDSLWSLVPLGANLAHPNEPALRARVLEELLSYIKAHGKSSLAQRQVLNVIALAEACLVTYPRLVATVFGVLDKLLKEMGQKHLVRDVAMLSKSAAQRAGVDREMKLAMIRSLICGLTWYYQRVGDLEEANATANKSYRFALDVDSKVDLAFSAKCTGRLRRIEAEVMAPNERQSKLSESIGMLVTAIQNFSEAEGHGPDGAETGDCYCLMARTHLVAGDLIAARDKLNRAFARIPDDGGKDLIDALILAGDIELASGNNDEALLRYDQAVLKAQSPGREVTEMRARAFRQRGRLKRKIGNKAVAETDFKEAARIWGELDEPNFAAEVEFEMLDISVGLSDLPRSMLMNEPAMVRVQVMKLHIDNLSKYNSNNTMAAGRRAEPPVNYWKDLIKRAHDLVGFEVI
jgi:tetratricopeptide (TPR) repeat protein